MTEVTQPERGSKRQRTRERIVQAAATLFAERGFDDVTVAEITSAAGVARSTFFRYFPDKANVLFADDDASHVLLAKAVAGAARTRAPLGNSLIEALRAAHSACLVLADSKAIQALRFPMREQLIAETPQLQACSLVKEREYTDALEAALIEQGAEPLIALQAAHISTACYNAGYTEAFKTPDLLASAVDRAFKRLLNVGSARD
ncbi:TetR family transcriptional regulator [Actinacidiphila sp. bgisy167]|uniref:TetR family transcriptional regulator n=1 Tax=Actinacidiphila sp. bgisy167 TaxID=3413797 RepID=UPI003D759161